MRLKRAAKISEQFDCAVLGLPWDQFTVGDRVEADDIHTAAKRYSKRHDDSDLRDWYPSNIGPAPMHLARIICQRSNLRYDSKLRWSYASIIRITAALIVAGLFFSALHQNLSLADFVLRMVPVTPVLAWAAREYYRQRDTAEPLEDLTKEVRQLWADALSGKCDELECCRRSREFQNAMYMRRANTPLIMPFLYRLKRARLEEEMNVDASEFLRQLDIPAASASSTDAAATSEGPTHSP